MQEIKISAAAVNDLEHIDHIQRQAFIEELWEPKSLFHSILKAGKGFCFVACLEENYAGYILAYPTCQDRQDFEQGPVRQTEGHDCVYLHDLCVSPDYRGQRVAQSLLYALEVSVKKAGYKNITGISVQNTQEFWQRQEFMIGDHCTYHGEAAVKFHKNL